MKLSRDEMETIIKGNAASTEWEIVTADPKVQRKLARQGYRPDERPNPWGYQSFTIPFGKVRIAKAQSSRRGKPFGGRANLHGKTDQKIFAISEPKDRAAAPEES